MYAMPAEIISASAFAALLQKGENVTILDVRTLPEYREVRMAASTLHVPLDQITPESLRSVFGSTDQSFYVLCRSGKRAQMAADLLSRAGYARAIVVDGGLDACMSCGIDVVRGDVMSLERQVRILAGSLVLLGLLLGTLVAPAFYWISAFIGAGLIFAGVTGWCGGALLLAKAPWNQGR